MLCLTSSNGHVYMDKSCSSGYSIHTTSRIGLTWSHSLSDIKYKVLELRFMQYITMQATCLEKKVPELIHFHNPSPDSCSFPTKHVTKSNTSHIKFIQVMILYEQRLSYLLHLTTPGTANSQGFIKLNWATGTLISIFPSTAMMEGKNIPIQEESAFLIWSWMERVNLHSFSS